MHYWATLIIMALKICGVVVEFFARRMLDKKRLTTANEETALLCSLEKGDTRKLEYGGVWEGRVSIDVSASIAVRLLT